MIVGFSCSRPKKNKQRNHYVQAREPSAAKPHPDRMGRVRLKGGVGLQTGLGFKV